MFYYASGHWTKLKNENAGGKQWNYIKEIIARAVELSNGVEFFYLKGNGPIGKVDYFGLVHKPQFTFKYKLADLKIVSRT